MKKIISLLLVLAVAASFLLLAVSATGEDNTVLKVSDLAKKEYKKGEAVVIPSYTVEGLSEYTADVLVFLPNSEIMLLSHDNNGSVTSFANNKNLYRASFCVSDNSFCAEMKGEYTLRYVVYDADYNRTVSELTFKVS
ncbi:MAG: hypothetical protein MJ085_01110 [Clostridia bacterium]|nr:hypothetical protein [Clostridia bacterium]